MGVPRIPEVSNVHSPVLNADAFAQGENGLPRDLSGLVSAMPPPKQKTPMRSATAVDANFNRSVQGKGLGWVTAYT